MKFGAAVAVAMSAACALSAPAAEARILDHLQIKVGISGVLPDESATVSLIGGSVAISDEYVPTLAIEYFFSDRVSAELLCCAARHDVAATASGGIDLGKVTHFPPTLTLKYRWNVENNFQPYVGAGLNYTHFFDEEPGAVNSISYDDSVGPALQAGFDYRLDEHWSLNVDVRRIWINSDVTIVAGANTIAADVDIDPFVATIGVGYRF
jgi:outer membrane protein